MGYFLSPLEIRDSLNGSIKCKQLSGSFTNLIKSHLVRLRLVLVIITSLLKKIRSHTVTRLHSPVLILPALTNICLKIQFKGCKKLQRSRLKMKGGICRKYVIYIYIEQHPKSKRGTKHCPEPRRKNPQGEEITRKREPGIKSQSSPSIAHVRHLYT